MARELEGKVAAVTGAASGIGLASTEAMLAAGSRVVMVDRDEVALKALCNKYGDAVIPLVIDLLNPKDCATLLPRVLALQLPFSEMSALGFGLVCPAPE